MLKTNAQLHTVNTVGAQYIEPLHDDTNRSAEAGASAGNRGRETPPTKKPNPHGLSLSAQIKLYVNHSLSTRD